MSKIANVDAATLTDDEVTTLKSQVEELETLLKTTKGKEERAALAGQIEDLKDQYQPNRFNIAANVSPAFSDAVKTYAKSKSYTASTLLRYALERIAGRATDWPATDSQNEIFTLSTQVDRATRDALKSVVDPTSSDLGTQADVLRKAAADLVGYDLSLEPERAPVGQAMKEKFAQIKLKDNLFQSMWADETARPIVLRMLEAQGLTPEQVGIKA